MEIAFVSANKIHIELQKKQEGFLANVLARLTANPSKFIATMLIGNNIALVIYGFYMGDALVRWFQTLLPASSTLLTLLFTDLSLLTQTLISTLIILLTAEFLPKVLFQIYANTLLKLFAIPAYGFSLLFSFISWSVIKISDGILRVFFKTSGDAVQLSFTKGELGDYITEQMETVAPEDKVDSEIQMFQNALQFSTVKAREVMVPRTEIMAAPIEETPKQLAQLFFETGYSKMPLYQEHIDEIVGYVHASALFTQPQALKSIMLPIEFVPETMRAQDVLNLLIKKRKSMAIVLDEYGGTAGLITVEDIVEELFGDIEDEHDTTDLCEEQLGENSYKFSARLEIDYLNETYNLNLPKSEEYETLGGLIVNAMEEIPQQNAEVTIEHFHFHILETSDTKIDLVSLQVLRQA